MRLSTSPKIQSLILAATGGHAVLIGYLLASGNEKFYKHIVMPMARSLNPNAEDSHSMALNLCVVGMVPRCHYDSERLKTRVLGLKFNSPLGMAAGFDKNGDALRGIYRIGFGFAEIGSVTPQPQPGNPKPRVFRLFEDNAIINRYGFPSVGIAEAHKNIEKNQSFKTGPLGINLGANKTSQSVAQDFVDGVRAFKDVADYFVVNVSSPNTPGLRIHQQRDKLQILLKAVLSERDLHTKRIPVLLKIAPDLTEEDKISIAETVLQLKIDGLIVCNTTVERPDSLRSKHRNEIGGLSGEPLRQMALTLLRDMYRLTEGKIPIIGVGGISSGQDAYESVRAGASLLQLYTAFTFNGPPIVRKINRDLDKLLKKDGFSSVADAVGADQRPNSLTTATFLPATV